MTPDRSNQTELFPEFLTSDFQAQSPDRAEELLQKITQWLLDRAYSQCQPTAGELLRLVEEEFGWDARWVFWQAIHDLMSQKVEPRYYADYLRTNFTDDAIREALAGETELKKLFKSSLDELVRNSTKYRQSAAFREMIQFTAKFRDYAPYNNMLVKLQNPSCSFFASRRDWENRFGRQLIEEARPMLILAPMHPVMLVYDIDQTEGDRDPQKLIDFSSVQGAFEDRWMKNILENAERDKIQVQFKPLSSTHGGFATTRLRDGRYKMRVVIHNDLDAASAFTVLCHELAHIHLGHLGSDPEGWWPCRVNLSHSTVEIEAEATAYIVAVQLGLKPVSEAYLSNHIREGSIPSTVSVDLIAKKASKLIEMAERKLPERKKPAATKPKVS